MRVTPGRLIFASVLAVFALFHLGVALGIALPPPGPPWLLHGRLLAALVGLILAAGTVSLFTGRMLHRAALGLAALFALFAVLWLPTLFENIKDATVWTPVTEMTGFTGIALVLAGGRLQRPGVLLFTVPLVVIGIIHLIYPAFIASLIPAWIPARLFLAYFTGIAFIAASVAFWTGLYARWAALGLALEFIIFVVTTHLPRILGKPDNGDEWTSGLVALAFCSGGLIIASVVGNRRR